MKKSIAIILGSSRDDGNTSSLIDEFSKEIRDPLKVFSLLDYNISYFDYEHGNESDDFIKLCEELINYSDLVFATPVYWYSMSAPMKTFFDRTTDLITIRKDLGRAFKNKNTWLLVSGTDKGLPEGFEVPFERTSKYFDMNYEGCLFWSVPGRGARTEISKEVKNQVQIFAQKVSEVSSEHKE